MLKINIRINEHILSKLQITGKFYYSIRRSLPDDRVPSISFFTHKFCKKVVFVRKFIDNIKIGIL